MTDDNDTPGFDTLDMADEHRETAQYHVERAEDLETEAGEEFRQELEETLDLPEGGNCRLSRGYMSDTTTVEWEPPSDVVTELSETFPDHRVSPSLSLELTDGEPIRNIKGLVSDIETNYEDGAPVDRVLERASEIGMDRERAELEIEKLKQKGEVYVPVSDHLRTT